MRRLQVIFNGVTIADSRAALRVLETSQAPVYYLPPTDIEIQYLESSAHATFCEWKGQALYFDVVVEDRRARAAAWAYPHPAGDYAALRDFIAFYPHLMDKCLVDNEAAAPMPGGFYGGWVTSDVVGPFKGGPGTQAW